MTSSSSPSTQNPKSGIVAALEYTGIPPSLLKRPKLPGRNWLIFFGVTGSLIGTYVYDRRQCRVLREEYVGRVKSLAEEYSWRTGTEALDKDAHLAWPRKLTVYAAKWPGDEDHDVAMKYFRRYLKPIFVAAAVDYDMIAGKHHGDIATKIADDIKRKRSEQDSHANYDSFQPGTAMPPQYHAPTTAEQEALELAGGTVIIGRATLKEYFSGLVRGWTEPPTVEGRPNWGVDSREEKVRSMLDDSVFDEYESYTSTTTPSSSSPSSPSSPHLPLTPIPAVPPLLLVPFVNHIGFTQIPYMLIDFFYRRKHVRDGGEAAWTAVCGATRGWQGPIASENPTSTPYAPPPPQGGDLDFALHSEAYYKSSLRSPMSIPPSNPKARAAYYADLPKKLWVAREFAQRVHEGTVQDPSKIPSSEVQLRLERFEKEKRWMRDEEGWEIVRPERGVCWDERLRATGLRVFVRPSTSESQDVRK
ncbi:inner membrane protein import complex subunit Tim54-domain-containing protein [Lentinula raphanica]|nr:inner membrane protein import complex subunit Tim54-domain-containing protein [Lentinula raphanica]